MKRVLSLLLATVALISMSAAALAVDQTGETKVIASIESSYTLTIPKEQSVAYNARSTAFTAPVRVTGNVAAGKTVTVTATTTPLTCPTQDTAIPFRLQRDGADFVSEVWTDGELRSADPKELMLTIVIDEADWNAAKAGEYSGTVVFMAKLS